mgnify:CR=1 FL=1
MLIYVLICISLALVGLSIIELLYLFYLERLERERRMKIIELEQKCKLLTERLKQAEARLQEQILFIETLNRKQSEQEDKELCIEILDDSADEEWAEFIEDK